MRRYAKKVLILNKLRINFEPSHETNSHQARIFIDDEDYLNNKYLGIDPPEFFGQASLLKGGAVLIGRCRCGVIGCGDFLVDVNLDAAKVHWQINSKSRLSFHLNDYIQCISDASKFRGWETSDRTAERLVDVIFKGSKLDSGHKFTWASARIEKGKIKLSFENEGDQLLHSFNWDGVSPDGAELEARNAYIRLFN